PGGEADHPRLGDADVERARRIRLGERGGHRGLGEGGVDGDDALVARAQVEQRLAQGGAGGLAGPHDLPSPSSSATIGAAQPGTDGPTISRMARRASAGFGALPCHSGSFSMNDTPLPLTVWATMNTGRSLMVSAWSRALSIWPRSWPSTSRTAHPKALHLSATGSRSRIFSTNPSSWIPFWSRITQRLSSRWSGAPTRGPDMALSHTCPSWISPSPTTAYPRAALPASLSPRAMPMATESPWPSEPVAASIPGRATRSGWPCSGLPSFRR